MRVISLTTRRKSCFGKRSATSSRTLAVMSFKSLKKFVADQRIRAQAIRDINEAELEIERAQSAAARRQSEERQDLKMKDQRNQVWYQQRNLVWEELHWISTECTAPSEHSSRAMRSQAACLQLRARQCRASEAR